MFEELKSQLDSLAQEVALLKEQQALQTGECRWRASGRQCTRGEGSGRRPAPGPWLAPVVQPCRPGHPVQEGPCSA